MPQFILITGCSGAGKSTLLQALKDSGQTVVEEPGRRIVTEERATGGAALPWNDPAAFARRAVEVSRTDLEEARELKGPVFFDRGLIDAAVALEFAAGIPISETLAGGMPYSDPVFLAPPWPEIFSSDPERRHGHEEAVAEFRRLEAALTRLGCRVLVLPKKPVGVRLTYLLGAIESQAGRSIGQF